MSSSSSSTFPFRNDSYLPHPGGKSVLPSTSSQLSISLSGDFDPGIRGVAEVGVGELGGLSEPGSSCTSSVVIGPTIAFSPLPGPSPCPRPLLQFNSTFLPLHAGSGISSSQDPAAPPPPSSLLGVPDEIESISYAARRGPSEDPFESLWNKNGPLNDDIAGRAPPSSSSSRPGPPCPPVGLSGQAGERVSDALRRDGWPEESSAEHVSSSTTITTAGLTAVTTLTAHPLHHGRPHSGGRAPSTSPAIPASTPDSVPSHDPSSHHYHQHRLFTWSENGPLPSAFGTMVDGHTDGRSGAAVLPVQHELRRISTSGLSGAGLDPPYGLDSNQITGQSVRHQHGLTQNWAPHRESPSPSPSLPLSRSSSS